MDTKMFSGAFHANDVHFLLSRTELDTTPLDVKERLIQSGEKHYSEMLSEESPPSPEHIALYQEAVRDGLPRLTRDVMSLAMKLSGQCEQGEIVLISLVRGGVPLGIMLHRALLQLGRQSVHYGVSIIRDRGIDAHAMALIEAKHAKTQIFFVDGWTGKGAISSELQQSLALRGGYPDTPRLVVLADPAGTAWMFATEEDWLIPFGLLGAPVSGLISRTVFNPDGLHFCMQCTHLSAFECGTDLVEQVAMRMQQTTWTEIPVAYTSLERPPLSPTQQSSADVVRSLSAQYQISNMNRIKPSIAEATRAVMRRLPELVLVRSLDDPEIRLLRHLSEQKGVPILAVGEQLGPYRAVTIIKKVNHGSE